jgi:hypothetical protein
MRSNPCLPDRPRRTILLLRSLLRKNTTRQSFSPSSSSSSSSSLVFCRETPTILVSVLMRRIYTTQNTETCGVSRSLCEKTHPFLFRVSNVGSKKKILLPSSFFFVFFFCGRLSTKERASRRDPARKETRAHFLISNFQVAGVFSQGKTYLPRKHTRTHERDRTKTKTVVIALVCFCRLSAE